MKHLYLIYILACVTLIACSKKDSAINWNEELKNTVWAGEFRYTAPSAYTGNQPFSIVMGNDGTLTWSDITSTRPAGTWAVVDNKITITLPNNTTISATVEKDSWSNFYTPDISGFTINSLNVSARPEPSSLLNSTYLGYLEGSDLLMKFKEGGMLEVSLGGVNATTTTYQVEGAGLLFTYPSIISSRRYYAVFRDDQKLMNGLSIYTGGIPPKKTYDLFTANKVQL